MFSPFRTRFRTRSGAAVNVWNEPFHDMAFMMKRGPPPERTWGGNFVSFRQRFFWRCKYNAWREGLHPLWFYTPGARQLFEDKDLRYKICRNLVQIQVCFEMLVGTFFASLWLCKIVFHNIMFRIFKFLYWPRSHLIIVRRKNLTCLGDPKKNSSLRGSPFWQVSVWRGGRKKERKKEE